MTGSFIPTTSNKNNTNTNTNTTSSTDHRTANNNAEAMIAARRGYEVNEEVLQRWEAKRQSADGGGQFAWRISPPKQAGDREEVRMKALQLAALNAYKAATAPRPPHYVPADRTRRLERSS